MRSTSDFTFGQVPLADIPRSSFRRSHGYKTAFDAGSLIPFYVDEVLPGDTFNVRAELFARMSTPIYPIMDNLFLDVFFFYCPNRLLWSNWQKFCGEQVNPGDSIDYSTPVVTVPGGGFTAGSLADYFGIPTGKGTMDPPVAFHFRAYNLIWNEWFRDENLQMSIAKNVGDGPDSESNYGLKPRGKRHDYFTSCLPWPQKGTAVSIPLGTTAPLIPVTTGSGAGVPTFSHESGTANVGPLYQTAGTTQVLSGSATVTSDLKWQEPGLVADLSTATAATINTLRQAFQIQHMLEKDARAGTRYREILTSHFGVVSPDASLQRPEFLGGGTIPVGVHPVSQTSATGLTGGTTPIGKQGAFGVASGGVGFSKSFVEHGVLVGLLSVRADITYQQGINKMWSRRTRYEYYWPSLAHLGEQAVLKKEIYLNNNLTTDNEVFGYQERWAEYRYKPSLLTANFRSNHASTLEGWHLAQNFTSMPTLGDTFIQDNPPIDRVIAVPAEPHFILDSYLDIQTARPIPTYSIPGMLSRF